MERRETVEKGLDSIGGGQTAAWQQGACSRPNSATVSLPEVSAQCKTANGASKRKTAVRSSFVAVARPPPPGFKRTVTCAEAIRDKVVQ